MHALVCPVIFVLIPDRRHNGKTAIKTVKTPSDYNSDYHFDNDHM